MVSSSPPDAAAESRSRWLRSGALLSLPALMLLLAGCVDRVSGPGEEAREIFGQLECSIDERDFFEGGIGLGGIPALVDPTFVNIGNPGMTYVEETAQFPDPRIIGIVMDDQAYAIPHNILWWHEIVNMELPGGVEIAVTYCPLTGSPLVFDRARIGGAALQVSGLILDNNLVMTELGSNQFLFPQMMRGGRCGAADGIQMEMFPAIDIRWSRWKELHPATLVVSGDIGMGRDYTRYPYGSYEQDRDLLFPQQVPGPGEEIRPMKERVLGIPSLVEGDYGGLAVPFGELNLAAEAGVAAVYTDSPQGEVLVLWDGAGRGAMVFRSRTTTGASVTMETRDGSFVDVETESEWSVDGRAVSGPLEGASLEPIPDAYVAFWFAWENFQPDADVWTR